MFIYDSMVRYEGYNHMNSTVNHRQFKEAYKELVKRGVINGKN